MSYCMKHAVASTIIVCAALFSCSASAHDSLSVFRVQADKLVIDGVPDYYKQFSLEQVLSVWRLDSNACQGLRNFLMVEFLLDKLKDSLKSDMQVVYLLGSPNEIRHGSIYDMGDDKYTVHYIYYFDVRCTNGKVRKESDSCWLDILCHEKTGQVLGIYQPCS